VNHDIPGEIMAPAAIATETATLPTETQQIMPPTPPPPGDVPLPVAGRTWSHPATTVHGTEWFKYDHATRLPINGPLMERGFAIKTLMGNMITRNSHQNRKWSRLTYFLFMFPPNKLLLIEELTNENMDKENK
jgi:hypothetical protein